MTQLILTSQLVALFLAGILQLDYFVFWFYFSPSSSLLKSFNDSGPLGIGTIWLRREYLSICSKHFKWRKNTSSTAIHLCDGLAGPLWIVPKHHFRGDGWNSNPKNWGDTSRERNIWNDFLTTRRGCIICELHCQSDHCSSRFYEAIFIL
jgi:hypothetical protein